MTVLTSKKVGNTLRIALNNARERGLLGGEDVLPDAELDQLIGELDGRGNLVQVVLSGGGLARCASSNSLLAQLVSVAIVDFDVSESYANAIADPVEFEYETEEPVSEYSLPVAFGEYYEIVGLSEKAA